MSFDLADLLKALPWIAIPVIAAWRGRRARTLAEFPPLPPAEAPRVSVIVPARNEAHNIGNCVRSVLRGEHHDFELIVVDDHSADGTGDLARAAGAGDPRMIVLENDPLPEGWFGKQWACATGARHATGALLLFADADTTHAPDLLPRLVAARHAMEADLISVAGRQTLGSFWERIIQPQVFALLYLRFGGTEGVNRARRASDVIANGQCLMVTREAYDAVGGHGTVRHAVAEDLMLAQTMFASGRRVRLVLGMEQLATRMYTSLPELLAGWGKNVYAGGISAMPFGVLGRAFFPLLFLSAPVLAIYPPLMLVLALAGMVDASHLAPSAIATSALLVWWSAVYGRMREPIWYALLFPLGAVMLGYIFIGAMIRGRRVAWKGREYLARG